MGKARPYWLEPLLPFRPASRRTAQAGRLCYQKRFFKHARSYTKLLAIPIGLLINFHELKLVDGIRRLILPGANES